MPLVAAYDFTNESAAGLRFAAALSRATGSPLSVVHVHPTSFRERDVATPGVADEPSEKERVVVKGVEDALRERARAACGNEVDTALLRGEPIAELLAFAKEREGTLVVGYRPRTDLHLTGPHLRRFLAEAEVPVIAVPAGERGAPKRILACTSFAHGDEKVELLAAQIAGSSGAELHLLQAVPGAVSHPNQAGDQVEDDAAGKRAAEERMASLKEAVPSLNAQLHRRSGDPNEVIARYAARAEVDLIMVGIRKRSAIERAILGSVVTRLLRDGTTPVFAVPCPRR